MQGGQRLWWASDVQMCLVFLCVSLSLVHGSSLSLVSSTSSIYSTVSKQTLIILCDKTKHSASLWFQYSFCAVFSFEGANSFSSPFSALLLLLTELISNRTFLGTGKSVTSIQICEKMVRQSQDSPHKDGDLSHCAPPSVGGGLLTWAGVAHRPSHRRQISALAD